MPHTLAALETGVLSEWRATLLVRESACLDVEDRRRLDAEPAAPRRRPPRSRSTWFSSDDTLTGGHDRPASTATGPPPPVSPAHSSPPPLTTSRHRPPTPTSALNGEGLYEACNYTKQTPDRRVHPSTDDTGRHTTHITTPTGTHHHSQAPPQPQPMPLTTISAVEARLRLEIARDAA
jgi:hypothetical protein